MLAFLSLVFRDFLDVCEFASLSPVSINCFRIAFCDYAFSRRKCFSLDLQLTDFLCYLSYITEILSQRCVHCSDVLLVFSSLGKSLNDLLQYSCFRQQFSYAVCELHFAILSAFIELDSLLSVLRV